MKRNRRRRLSDRHPQRGRVPAHGEALQPAAALRQLEDLYAEPLSVRVS